MILYKNHKEHLERLLPQLSKCCDEIYAMDSGSDDGSSTLLARFGAKVHQHAWTDDFGEQTERLRKLLPQDVWVLRIDADEKPNNIFVNTIREFTSRIMPASDSALNMCMWVKHINLVQDELHYDANSVGMQARIFYNRESTRFTSRNHVHPELVGGYYGFKLPDDIAILHYAALDEENIHKKREYYRKIGGFDALDGYKLMYPEHYKPTPLPLHLI